jgi:deoxycytidine triphosphate deaminase
MEDLQARLEQAKKDIKIAVEAAGVEIAALEKQIADSEVTYSIGDRFVEDGKTGKYILVRVRENAVLLTRLDDGNRWTGHIDVKDDFFITPKEFLLISTHEKFVRYWDARLKQKVS